MGAAINACTELSEHQKLSKSLVAFTKKAKGIVERADGRIIYAGGDDVLAFLPTTTALGCAQKLAKKFEEIVGKPIAAILEEHQSKASPPTLSVGLVIAHHLNPLSDTLELSAQAEKAAKKTRNALAVLISKRSGTDMLTAGLWGELDVRLKKMIGYYASDALPQRLGYELREIARQTEGLEDNVKFPIEALELKRILQRKRPDKGQADKLRDDIADELQQLITKQHLDLLQLSTMLEIAMELASLAGERGQH